MPRGYKKACHVEAPKIIEGAGTEETWKGSEKPWDWRGKQITETTGKNLHFCLKAVRN